MIRFPKLVVSVAMLAIAIVGFSGTKAEAMSPAKTPVVSSVAITQPPLQPASQFAADWLQLEDLKCGSDVDLDFSLNPGDWGPAIKDLLGSLMANYVICPVIGFMYNGIGLIINAVIGPLLKVDPLLQNGSPSATGKYLYSAWSVFRDLANVGLAFAVLLLVFSQATSYGLNAYGIRKLLPKIVMAALMINLSFIICALLIDIFNILGDSLGNLLTTAISTAANADGVSIGDQIGLAGTAIAAIMVAGGGVLAVGALFIVPVVFFIVLLLGLLTLMFAIARQILIAFLIVVAPVAIASWLFPNTDRYFSKWWSTFVKLLAIYPVVTSLQALTLVFLLVLSSMML